MTIICFAVECGEGDHINPMANEILMIDVLVLDNRQRLLGDRTNELVSYNPKHALVRTEFIYGQRVN